MLFCDGYAVDILEMVSVALCYICVKLLHGTKQAFHHFGRNIVIAVHRHDIIAGSGIKAFVVCPTNAGVLLMDYN